MGLDQIGKYGSVQLVSGNCDTGALSHGNRKDVATEDVSSVGIEGLFSVTTEEAFCVATADSSFVVTDEISSVATEKNLS